MERGGTVLVLERTVSLCGIVYHTFILLLSYMHGFTMCSAALCFNAQYVTVLLCTGVNTPYHPQLSTTLLTSLSYRIQL